MNAVGIDVSKGKSTVAILRPLGEVVSLPFDVTHDLGILHFYDTRFAPERQGKNVNLYKM